jgi:hypothetical protein
LIIRVDDEIPEFYQFTSGEQRVQQGGELAATFCLQVGRGNSSAYRDLGYIECSMSLLPVPLPLRATSLADRFF